jgi:hypothetical protein
MTEAGPKSACPLSKRRMGKAAIRLSTLRCRSSPPAADVVWPKGQPSFPGFEVARFVEAEDSMRVAGRVHRRLDLAAGAHAVVENGREFNLVPWRRVLSRSVGREVSGLVRRGSVSWSLGRGCGPEI